jgi:hypothetical protein
MTTTTPTADTLRAAIIALRDALPAGQQRRDFAMQLARLAGDNAIRCNVPAIDARAALNAGADQARREAMP